MHIIPVLDILDGLVVRGVAGERKKYRPVESRWTADVSPQGVARALRTAFGCAAFYVADLDGILHDRPGLEVIRTLTGDGCALWIDAGVREPTRAADLLAAGAAGVVAGLETLPGPELLGELVAAHGPDRVVFSLDLRGGAPLANQESWGDDAWEIGARAVVCGVTQILVLDLAGVGVGQGVPTLPLCRRLRDRWPALRLLTGGGVRGLADLTSLRDAGIDGALVASALHDGRILPADLDAWSADGRCRDR